MSGQQENLRAKDVSTESAIVELRDDVRNLAAAVDRGFRDLRQDLAQVNTAFTVDDLGRPDHNGHRLDHKRRMEEAKVAQNYKIEAAKRLITLAVTFLFGLLASGIADTIRRYAN